MKGGETLKTRHIYAYSCNICNSVHEFGEGEKCKSP